MSPVAGGFGEQGSTPEAAYLAQLTAEGMSRREAFEAVRKRFPGSFKLRGGRGDVTGLMPTEPTGRVQSIIDLMEQIDRGQFEEAQVAGARRGRLWDIAMPGIERLAELSRATLEGRFRETPVGRAVEAGVMRQTAGLRGRIRNLMARRGVTGQPIETAALGRAEIEGGRALQEIPVSQIGAATQVAGGTLPSLTQLTRPEFPRVQTGALQYLGQVLPYNLSLEGLYSRFAEMLGRGRGEQEIYRRPPTTGIEELFDVVRPTRPIVPAGGGAI